MKLNWVLLVNQRQINNNLKHKLLVCQSCVIRRKWKEKRENPFLSSKLKPPLGLDFRHLQHDRFPAKINNMLHRVAYTTHHISYIHCIRLDTNGRISWAYCHFLSRGISHNVVYSIFCRDLLFHVFPGNWTIIWGRPHFFNSQES